MADPATHPDARDARRALPRPRARRRARRHGRRADARHRRGDRRRRRSSAEAITLLQAMKTGALLRFSVEAGAILAGASRRAARGADRLRRSARRGLPGRRRYSRCGEHRGGARQARRQGRRAQQGDLRLRSRPRARQGAARRARRKGARPRSTRPASAPKATYCAKPPASSPSARPEPRPVKLL